MTSDGPKRAPVVVWRALLRESTTLGICSRQAAARWHAWQPDATRSLCRRARDWDAVDGEMLYRELRSFAGGVTDQGNRLCAVCLERLMCLVSDDAAAREVVEVPQSPRAQPEASQVVEPMQIEFVSGSPLDGIRVRDLRVVLHDATHFTIVGQGDYTVKGRATMASEVEQPTKTEPWQP